jgi:hypothetical protein
MASRRRFIAGMGVALLGATLTTVGTPQARAATAEQYRLIDTDRLIDITDWLQAQIDKGGTITLAAGRYVLSRTIKLAGNVILIGNGTELIYRGTGSAILLDGPKVGVASCTMRMESGDCAIRATTKATDFVISHNFAYFPPRPIWSRLLGLFGFRATASSTPYGLVAAT